MDKKGQEKGSGLVRFPNKKMLENDSIQILDF